MKLLRRRAAYENLKFYQDICEIRKFVYGITERIRKSHMRLVSQMRDAARSAKQNIREGYRKGTLGEFRRGIVISLGSLEELSGDIEDCKEDDLITNEEFNKFSRMYQSAGYMANRYLISLNKIEREGIWKVPLGKLRKVSKSSVKFRNVANEKETSRNITKPKETLRNISEPKETFRNVYIKRRGPKQ